jgi:hypothetical protein
LKGHNFEPCRYTSQNATAALQLAGKSRFWVAQRFQRCDKVFLFCVGFLAPEASEGSFSADRLVGTIY